MRKKFLAVASLLMTFATDAHSGDRPDPARKPRPMADAALIQAGTFETGTAVAELDSLRRRFGTKTHRLFLPEVPRHTVHLDAFSIDRHEVTNARFKAFLDAQPRWRRDRIPPRYHNGDYLKHWSGDACPPGRADHPVVYVGWYAAVAYCQWEGKRLPTEAEWEVAARGGLSEKQFPWGDAPPDSSRANFQGSGLDQPTTVGSYAPNGYGLYDMAGNVWEYCADEWREDFYKTSPPENPMAGTEADFLSVTARRVIRGGSWGGAPVNLRVAYRDSHPPEGAGGHVGFRCAKSTPAR